MKALKALASLYRPSFCRTIIYMLQSNEYNTVPYLAWFWRTQDFSKIMSNPKFAAVMKDPELAGLLSKMNPQDLLKEDKEDKEE